MARAVIATIGQDRPGLVNELSEVVLGESLNIEDSRMTVLGGEFAVLMSVSGSTGSLDALEAKLEALGTRSGFAFLFRRTTERASARVTGLSVRVEAMDHPGIVHRVARFFSERGINIRELETETEPAAHTGTPVFSLRMEVEVPEAEDLKRLTAAFTEFCEVRALDGELAEPAG